MSLHHEVEGSGRTVVFVHEGIVDSRVWDPQWSSFEAYRRIRFDLRGFGRSPIGSLPLTHARDVIELLDGLGVSVAALHAVGDRLAREIPDARFSTIPRAAHVPHLERPADFDAFVLDFLSNVFTY